MTACCPACHQPLATMRCGIRLPVLKTQIFDAIKAAGDLGAGRDEIFNVVYPDRRRQPNPSVIKSRIVQINDFLEETTFLIVADGRRCDGSRYYLVRRR
jgi:hypothetical protein